MSGTPAPQLPAFLLQEEDLVAEVDPIGVTVVRAAKGDGLGVLEAFIRCCFKPEAVDRTLWFYQEKLPIIAPNLFREAGLLKGQLRSLMQKALIIDAGAAVRIGVEMGMLTVEGLPPGHFKSVKLDKALVMKGQLDAVEETITDYRTGHLIGNVRLRPTRKALEARMPAFNHAAAFTAALDELKCWRPGSKGERIITTTKAELHAYLEKRHPGQFGTLKTFSRNYSRDKEQKGRRTGDLKFSIQWMHSHYHD